MPARDRIHATSGQYAGQIEAAGAKPSRYLPAAT